METGKDDALLTSLGWACHCALPRHTLSKWAGPGPVLGLGFFVFLRSTRPPPLRSRSVCRGSVGAGALPCWRRSPTVVSAEGSNYSSAVMAAAGGGIAGGGGATTSGCGLKRRYAPHDQEVPILLILLGPLLLLVFARLPSAPQRIDVCTRNVSLTDSTHDVARPACQWGV